MQAYSVNWPDELSVSHLQVINHWWVKYKPFTGTESLIQLNKCKSYAGYDKLNI